MRIAVFCCALALAACTVERQPPADTTHADTTHHDTTRADSTIPRDSSAPPPDAALRLWPGARRRAPHWPHASFVYTDFRYSYYDTASRPILARRYDAVMSGSGAAWHRLDSAIVHIPYRLLWSIFQPGQRDAAYDSLAAWYRRHPAYGLEHAFLHDTGTAGDSAHRRVWVDDSKNRRWLTNPADPGFRAYQTDQLGALLARGEQGVFFDEFGRGTMARAFRSLELDTLAYQRAIVSLLATLHATYPEARIVVNTAAYTTPFDLACATAAGGAQLEQMDYPFSANQPYVWRWIDTLLAAGVRYVEYVSALSWTDRLPATMSAGSEVSPRARQKMAEYVSFLLIQDTARRVVWNHDNAWTEDPASHWLRAFEADLGRPIGARSKRESGRDPVGQSYTVWQRDYERALVLLRTVNGWDPPRYDDSTAVPITLGRPYRRLRSDGVLAPPDTVVHLRAGEGAILIP